MEDQDFRKLIAQLETCLPEKETSLTIGGSVALSLFAALIAFLCIGYFTNAGDIKELKLTDKYTANAQVELKTSVINIEKTVMEIRMDQVRRERKEGG